MRKFWGRDDAVRDEVVDEGRGRVRGVDGNNLNMGGSLSKNGVVIVGDAAYEVNEHVQLQ
jgi:hypothetical protein